MGAREASTERVVSYRGGRYAVDLPQPSLVASVLAPPHLGPNVAGSGDGSCYGAYVTYLVCAKGTDGEDRGEVVHGDEQLGVVLLGTMGVLRLKGASARSEATSRRLLVMRVGGTLLLLSLRSSRPHLELSNPRK